MDRGNAFGSYTENTGYWSNYMFISGTFCLFRAKKFHNDNFSTDKQLQQYGQCKYMFSFRLPTACVKKMLPQHRIKLLLFLNIQEQALDEKKNMVIEVHRHNNY